MIITESITYNICKDRKDYINRINHEELLSEIQFWFNPS